MRTQVGIIGAGPAGLMLARLLHLAGIDSIIIENRSRNYIENRIRAGLIEHWAADLLTEVGVGERMKREGILHWGINIGINGDLHRIDFKALVDKRVTIYGQQEVVKDLVERRLADGGPLLFEVDGVSVHDLTSQRPKIRFTHEGSAQEIDCDFIAGCDGFHGICRPSIPDGVLSVFERDYPFGWLGILSESAAAGSRADLFLHRPRLCALHHALDDAGAALSAMRPRRGHRRAGRTRASGTNCTSGWAARASSPKARSLQKGITPMRSFVVEPMQHGRLFLAGDSAHIVPPTGAKGMNLAFADVRRAVARARGVLQEQAQRRSGELFGDLPAPRLEGAAFLLVDDADPAPLPARDRRSTAAASSPISTISRARKPRRRSLAEQYVGLPLD